jgi:hypothetical protein
MLCCGAHKRLQEASMSFVETELPQPRLTPMVFLGAASPLWAYFGAATAGGLAYWWMTQWARPANLEALFNAAALAIPGRKAVEETIVEPVAAIMEAAFEPTPPIGGESAPVSPLVTEPESPVLPAVEVETDAAVAPMAAAAEPPVTEPEPAARPKKSAPPSPTVN